MNREMIEQYAAGGLKLRQAVAGLSREDFLADVIPGTWSIQQIVIHLADSDLIAADRMKRIIAEDNPAMLGYDQSKFAQHLHYDEQSVEDAAAIFELSRRQLARVLRKLPDAAFQRAGMHNERGPLTLDQMVRTYVGHLDHHLEFLYDKRRKLGKPLS